MPCRIAFLVVCSVLAPSALGCANTSTSKHQVPHDAADVLPWLTEDTTREDVLLELGSPFQSFEDGRILCYFLAKVEDRNPAPLERPTLASAPRHVAIFEPIWGSWRSTDFDLVLVFGRDGRVEKHRLFSTVK